MHQREAGGEFIGALAEAREQAVGDWLGCSRPRPEPPILRTRGRAQRRLAISPQHRGERTFIARGNGHAVQRRRHALPPGFPLGAGFAVTGEGGVFAFHTRQFGPCGGERTGDVVAPRLQIGFAGLVFGEFRAQAGDRFGCLVSGLARGDNVCLGIAVCCQIGAGTGDAGGLGFDPGEPLFGLLHGGLSDPPFGLDPGVICGRLGEREFGGAARAFAVLRLVGKGGAGGFGGGDRGAAGFKLLRQPRQSLDRRAGQAVGIVAVFFQPGALPGEVAQTGFGGIEFFRKRRHPVPMRAGIVTPVGEFVARFGKGMGSFGLLLLRDFYQLLRLSDFGLGLFGSGARGLGGGGGFAPAGEQQACLGGLNPVGEFGIAFRLLGLPLQRGDLRVEPGHQVFQPGKIGLGGAQLALGVLAADVQASDPGGLLKHRAAFCRAGGDHLRDLALTNERGGVRASGRIGEGEGDVLGAHVAAVDAVGAACAALDPPGDDQFLVPVIAGVEHHFGKVAGWPRGGAREDHVLHPARSHRLGRGFPHHPADRFEQVGLAAAVGADDPGQAGFDSQFRRLDEALEAAELEPVDLHLRGRASGLPQRAPAR